jgi:hypothetical protein
LSGDRQFQHQVLAEAKKLLVAYLELYLADNRDDKTNGT